MEILKSLIVLAIISFFLPLNAQNFNDDLSGKQMGDFPSKWDLLAGSAHVDVIQGKKAVKLADDSMVTPLIEQEDYLGDSFTLMTDLFFDQVTKSVGYQNYKLRFWPGVGSGKLKSDQGTKTFSAITIKRNGSSMSLGGGGPKKEFTNYLSDLRDYEPVWRQIKVQFENQTLKVFIDDHLILNIPNYEINPSKFSIEAGGQSSLTRALADFSLQGAMPMPDYDLNNSILAGAMPMPDYTTENTVGGQYQISNINSDIIQEEDKIVDAEIHPVENRTAINCSDTRFYNIEFWNDPQNLISFYKDYNCFTLVANPHRSDEATVISNEVTANFIENEKYIELFISASSLGNEFNANLTMNRDVFYSIAEQANTVYFMERFQGIKTGYGSSPQDGSKIWTLNTKLIHRNSEYFAGTLPSSEQTTGSGKLLLTRRDKGIWNFQFKDLEMYDAMSSGASMSAQIEIVISDSAVQRLVN